MKSTCVRVAACLSVVPMRQINHFVWRILSRRWKAHQAYAVCTYWLTTMHIPLFVYWNRMRRLLSERKSQRRCEVSRASIRASASAREQEKQACVGIVRWFEKKALSRLVWAAWSCVRARARVALELLVSSFFLNIHLFPHWVVGLAKGRDQFISVLSVWRVCAFVFVRFFLSCLCLPCTLCGGEPKWIRIVALANALCRFGCICSRCCW